MYNGKKKKKPKKFEWKINDLCAVFITKFGNWYRGKILKLNTENKKSSVSVHYLLNVISLFNIFCFLNSYAL